MAQQITDNGFDVLANMPEEKRMSALANAIAKTEFVTGKVGGAGAGTFAAAERKVNRSLTC